MERGKLHVEVIEHFGDLCSLEANLIEAQVRYRKIELPDGSWRVEYKT